MITMNLNPAKIDHLKLPRLVSDGMVLQRGVELKIWGWAPVGQRVIVCFLDKEYSTITAADGRWIIELPALKAGGPYKMVIKDRNSLITINDILIGDVWVCSGQSNMEIPIERVRELYEEEIINCENPEIRHFSVPLKYSFDKPQQDLEGGCWQAVDPESVLKFTAVGYFFARELYEKYHVPVGLIKASIGGSPIEAWLSEEALQAFPEYLALANRYKDQKFVQKIEKENAKIDKRWYKNLYHLDKGLGREGLPWYDPDCDTSDWSSMELPTYFAEEGLENFNGVIWFRKEIEIPAELANKPARLWMGRIVDGDTAFINGKRVGATTYQYPPRKYDIPANLLQEGKNIIALRVISNEGQGGFVEDKPYKLTLGKQNVDLKGYWQYKVGAVTEPKPEINFVQWKPLGLFNGMIAPLINYRIKGVIWYQGESNISNPVEYQKLFPALIRDWREKWAQGDFPFLYVQLPNYGKAKDQPSESEWAELREAQLKALTVPNTAVAVTIDLGEWNDLHPLNKKDVGKRLALAAQYLAYGDSNVVYSGPLYQSMEIKGQSIEITFTNTGSGLVIKNGGRLRGFTIAGQNKKFYQAEARISRNKVVVKNNKIANPVAVRYAWADNPEEANLYNKEGLPASPFRTD